MPECRPRRRYLFFVSDTPDQEAIDRLAEVYIASQYDIRAVMRTLFLSDDFRAPHAYYAKVKSPAEPVIDGKAPGWCECGRAPGQYARAERLRRIDGDPRRLLVSERVKNEASRRLRIEIGRLLGHPLTGQRDGRDLLDPSRVHQQGHVELT